MKLAAIYRLDYPLHDPDAADGALPAGYDLDGRVENQPLGLFFQFTAWPAGLLLELASDAEQVLWRVATLDNFLTKKLDCFGFASPVLPDSTLGKLLGSELRQIQFGFVNDCRPTNRLLFGIKMRFGAGSLLFMNQADEGAYLFEGTTEYNECLSWYRRIFGQPVWVEQPQLLAQLAQR